MQVICRVACQYYLYFACQFLCSAFCVAYGSNTEDLSEPLVLPPIPMSDDGDGNGGDDDEGDPTAKSRLVVHNGVSVERHRWAEHTNDHDPCESRSCGSGEVCRVVRNPVLQFPVPVCEHDGSQPGKKAADVVATIELESIFLTCKACPPAFLLVLA